jgi:hypothetical protein
VGNWSAAGGAGGGFVSPANPGSKFEAEQINATVAVAF